MDPVRETRPIRISPNDTRGNQLHPRSNGVKFRPPVHELLHFCHGGLGLCLCGVLPRKKPGSSNRLGGKCHNDLTIMFEKDPP